MLLFRTVLAALAILPAIANPVPETPKAGNIIPDAYIVVLKNNVSAQAIEEHKTWTTSIHSEALKKRGEALPVKTFTYEYDMETVKGYAGIFDKSTIDEIAARDEVAFVEPDTVVTAAGLTTQTPAKSAGLVCISHRTCHGSGYIYHDSAGQGVDVYVLDSGIFIGHSSFGGRAKWGHNFAGGKDTDEDGHGTHVAGIIGSTDYGVAKKARLIAVKVLNNDMLANVSTVVNSINWVVSEAAKNPKTKSVANISFGTPDKSSIMNNAVADAVKAGITVAISAGNYDMDAGEFSPASEASALTVGAIDGNFKNPARASYSNFGDTLDIFAPGSGIVSTWIGGPDASKSASGTSMASAHVAGVAAYLIAKENLKSPDAVRERILQLAGTNLVKDPGPGSPNKLLYNDSGK